MSDPVIPPAEITTGPGRATRLWIAAGVLAFVVVAAASGVITFSDSKDQMAAPVGTLLAPTTIAGDNLSADLGQVALRAAVTKGQDLAVFAAPDDSAAPVTTLSKQTVYKLPRTLLSFDRYGQWLHVYLPTRPNGSTGWIKSSDVDLSAPLEWQIRVSLADHHLWLFHRGAVNFQADVAIGTPQYPTPTGTFYITDPIDLHSRPNQGYGVFALGLSGHSDVLNEFMGSDGQIAIHGTGNPGDMGRSVSHGCVRVLNSTIELLSQLPIGTPVVIA